MLNENVPLLLEAFKVVDVVSFNVFFFSLCLERLVHESQRTLEEVKERFHYGRLIQRRRPAFKHYLLCLYLLNQPEV